VTSRPYHSAASFDWAMSRVAELSGIAFDPEMVRAMTGAIKDQQVWKELGAISSAPASSTPASSTPRIELGDASDPDRTLRRIFGREIEGLPTLPHVVSQVLEKTRNANSSLDEIVSLISTDQALVSTFLRLVNSAFYGFSRRIATLKQAITLLGFRSVRNVVVNAGVVGIFRRRAFDVDHRRRLWDHSVACAVTARLLAERQGYAAKEEAFTAGLLHDIGKVVIDQYAPKHSAAILVRVAAGEDRRSAETEVLGVDHTKIGAWIAERWHLPKALCSVIEHHHAPEGASGEIEGTAALVRIVAAANAMCRISPADEDAGVAREVDLLVASPRNWLKLDSPSVRSILDETWARKADAMKMFGDLMPTAAEASPSESSR
jgi:putative nucleotidyltransferase with HDIG domain